MPSLRTGALLEANGGLGVAGRKRGPALADEQADEGRRQKQRPRATRMQCYVRVTAKGKPLTILLRLCQSHLSTENAILLNGGHCWF